MATNAEEFLIRLNSNLQQVASRDEAALRALDSQIRAVERNLSTLDAKALQAAAASAAQAKRVEAASAALQQEAAGAAGSANVAAVRAAQARLAREQQALDTAKQREQAVAAAAAKEREQLAILKGARGAFAERAEAASKEAAAAREAAKVKASDDAAARTAAKDAAAAAQAAAKVKAGEAAAAREAAKSKRAEDAAVREAARAVKASETAAAREAAKNKRIKAEEAREAAKKQREIAKAAREAARDGAAASAALSQGLQVAGGPLAFLSSRLSSLAPLAELSAAAVVALGVAALGVAIVTGAVAAVVALTRFGIAAAEARRQSVGLGEALSGVSRRPAQEFVAVVDQLSQQVPIARAQLQDLTRDMALLRLGGRDMQAGAVAVAFATSAIGDAAGGAVKGIVQQSAALRRFTLGARDMWGEFQGLAGTGLTKADVVGALAKQMNKSAPEVEKALVLGRVKLKDGLRALEAAARSRFGGTVAGQMADIGVQIDKTKERVGRMFRDINTRPLLDGLAEFNTLLDESTVSGKAFRFLFTTGTQAIVDGLGAGARAAGKFFQGMAIASLKAYIAIKPTYNAVRDFLGLKQAPSWLTAVNAGKVAFYALAAAVGIVAVSLALAAVPFVLIGAAIYGIVAAVQYGVGKLTAAFEWISVAISIASAAIKNADWGALAQFAIDALVSKFRAGADYVADAVRGLADRAAGAFKAALGIASPSKLFGQFADWTVRGFVNRIEAGQPEAAEATAALGSGQPAVSVDGPTVNVRAQGGQGGGNVFHFYFQGQQNARDFAEEFMAIIGGTRVMGPAEAT